MAKIVACGYCGTFDGKMHRDHLIPQSRGGADAPENCVLACSGCNQAKSDMTPSEWMPEGLPPMVYERERRLAKKYAMRSMEERRRSKGGPKPGGGELAKAVRAIASSLETPNECDSNGERAGVTDGLYEVARAIRFLGRSVARATCAASGHEWREGLSYGNFQAPAKCAWCGVERAGLG